MVPIALGDLSDLFGRYYSQMTGFLDPLYQGSVSVIAMISNTFVTTIACSSVLLLIILRAFRLDDLRVEESRGRGLS